MFALCSAYGERVATATTDERGLAAFQGIPFGEYTIREIIAPEGYLLCREPITIMIDASYRNREEAVATVTDQEKRMCFRKVNTAGEPLAGAAFQLINAVTGEVVEEAVSGLNGDFLFTRFDYGAWLVHESSAPDGYSPMEDLFVTVDERWTAGQTILCVNLPDHYAFRKTDHQGNPMAGVRFVLLDEAENALREVVSDADGIVSIDGLTPGAYTVREIETLEGFSLSREDMILTVDKSFVLPDEIPAWVNYPVIQTGAGIELTPMMRWGFALLGLGVAVGAMVLVRTKRRK